MPKNNFEQEVTLAIISENPQYIIRSIVSKKEIVEYPLLFRKRVMIHDIYFDTPDGILRKNKLIFRVRKEDQHYKITFKGPVYKREEGFAERPEAEGVWSQEELSYIINELRKHNVQIPESISSFDHTEPVEYMKKLGLNVIQYRENQRYILDIVSSQDKSTVLAEIVLDTVIYHLDNYRVKHHEIEIESKNHEENEGYQLIKILMEHILLTYHGHIQKWNYGKLTTGQALEKLLNEGKPDDILKEDKSIKPEAYKFLEHYLNIYK
ncbi:CYTH domain-containing protein [Candidatus Poribacteria bacterium]|nr:CYTH domain-containing protein [Candidatus Poribacteria bacterium]